MPTTTNSPINGSPCAAVGWKYGYDSLGQVTSGKKHWNDGSFVTGQQFEYSFDDIGNRTFAKRGGDSTGANLRESDYTPNNLNQYTQRTVPAYVDVIGIAAAGSTVSVNSSSAGVERRGEYYRKELSVSNGSAQYPAVSVETSDGTNTGGPLSGNLFVPPSTETYLHDEDGNLKQDGRWVYIWDGENRLVKMETTNAPSGSVRRLEFKYDWRGRRIYKKETNLDTSTVTERKFVYDGWNLYAELDGNNALVQTYIWGMDLSGSAQGAGGVGGLVGVKPAGSQVHFVAYDGNGNVVGLVDGSSGTISASYEYGPFGESLRVTGTIGKENPFRFSTKYIDDETDLAYYGHRYYVPSVGKWLSRDPKGEAEGENIYVFTLNRPCGAIDHLGLETLTPDGAQQLPFDEFKKWLEDNFGGPIEGGQLDELKRGCVGACRVVQFRKTQQPYPQRTYPEGAKNTKCFKTKEEAENSKCSSGKESFVFAKQGPRWNGSKEPAGSQGPPSDPGKEKGEIPLNSIYPNAPNRGDSPGPFNYVFVCRIKESGKWVTKYAWMDHEWKEQDPGSGFVSSQPNPNDLWKTMWCRTCPD